MKPRRVIVALVGALTLIVGACSSDGGSQIFGEGTSPPQQDDGNPFDQSTDDTTGSGGEDDGDVGPSDSEDGTADAYRPLPLREGLGTFDSYEWHMEMTTIGPTSAETTSIVTDWSRNLEPSSTHNLTETTSTGPDIDPETTVQEVYAVEGETCQFDGEDWVYEAATDQQQEVLDVVERLFDITIVPESPVEVGSDVVAGIRATHWSYTVSGFGADSGALVTANQVDYWVAEDTTVLLKYALEIESRSGPSDDPDAEVYRVEASAELVSADQPIPIELPAECLAARDSQETEG